MNLGGGGGRGVRILPPFAQFSRLGDRYRPKFCLFIAIKQRIC